MSQGVTDDEIIAAIPAASDVAERFARRYGDSVDWREEALLGLVIASKYYEHRPGWRFEGFVRLVVDRMLKGVCRRWFCKHVAPGKFVPRKHPELMEFGGPFGLDPVDARKEYGVDGFEAADELIPLLFKLAPAERDIFRLRAEGLSYTKIDGRLGYYDGRSRYVVETARARLAAAVS
jgi:hypothetical protein